MNLYEVLGVAQTAPPAEVRQAYVALARQHHPDRTGGDADAMRAVNQAWATLSDPARRAEYDLSLRVVRPAPVPEPPPPLSDEESLLADLEDDTPLGGLVVLPRWISLLPVTVFVLSVAAFCAGVLFASQAALGAAATLFLLSCAMFLAAPFVALLSSRRRTGDGASGTSR